MEERLWDIIKRKSKVAIENGSLISYKVNKSYIEQNNIKFWLHIRERTEEKKEKPNTYINNSSPKDPFLPPYDPDLHIEWPIDERYALLLNKFRVLKDHLLIVTKEFFHQSQPLAEDDLFILHQIMVDCGDALGFYNCGLNSGSSQTHRHMQVVPLKKFENGFLDIISLNCIGKTEAFRCEAFLFDHIIYPLSSQQHEKEILYSIYNQCLEEKVRNRDNEMCHSLIYTTTWMMVVPRSKDEVEQISINSLGFTGCFYLSRSEFLKKLEEVGCMNILGRTGYPC